MDAKYPTSISHIQFHFKVDNNPFTIKKCYCTEKKKFHNNFCTVRKNYTYQIFREKGTVCSSKVANFENVNKSITYFTKLFNIPEKDIKKDTISINNITLKGQIHNVKVPLILTQLKRHIIQNWVNDCIPNYNNLQFSGFYIYPLDKNGLITVFSSGKFSIVGVKCLAQAEKLTTLLYAIMSTFSLMKEKE